MLDNSDLLEKEGNLESSDDSSVQDKNELNDSESEKSYYQNDNSQNSGRASFFKRKKKPLLIGGGVTGVLLGGGFFAFTLFSGPLQFMHIGQLLDKFHFAEQKLVQDERFTRNLRYFRKGQPEKTRMGKLGNFIADKFEGKLNESGLKSSYSEKFGLFDGYVIDKTNPKYKNMTDQEIKDFIKNKYGVEPKLGSEIRGSNSLIKNELVIDNRSMGTLDSLKLTHALLGDAKLGSISSIIGSRFMGVRMGVNFSPLTKLKNNTKASIEEWFQKDRTKLTETQDSVTATDTAKNTDGQTQTQTDQETARHNTANSVFSDVTSSSASAKVGGAAFEKFKSGVRSKMFGGLSAAVGIVCILKAINDNIDTLKYTQVILPLIKLAMHTMAVGSQIQSGNNIDFNELGVLANQLNGIDAGGKSSSWYQSQSIQANLGNSNTGVAPSSTLTSIGTGGNKPFGFIDSIPVVGTLCGEIAQTAIMIFSFAADLTPLGLLTQVLSGIAISQGAAYVVDTAAHWMAGSAVDVNAIGADFGNEIDYGAALASNQQSIMSGGSALTPQQVAQNNLNNNVISQNEFSNKPLFAKLFDVNDYRSAVSKIADNLPSNYSSGVLSAFSYILDSGKNAISGISKLFTVKSLAASSVPYDYGFPIYGYSQDELSNPSISNPYENANKVSDMLVKDSSLIQKAKDCFGVNIAKDSEGLWNVTSDSSASDLNAYSSGYSKNNCNIPAPKDCTNNDSTECNWLRLRFFILDTETTNSMACYAGDNLSCSDIGM